MPEAGADGYGAGAVPEAGADDAGTEPPEVAEAEAGAGAGAELAPATVERVVWQTVEQLVIVTRVVSYTVKVRPLETDSELAVVIAVTVVDGEAEPAGAELTEAEAAGALPEAAAVVEAPSDGPGIGVSLILAVGEAGTDVGAVADETLLVTEVALDEAELELELAPEEPAEQVRLYRGVSPSVLPTMPKLGLGVVGAAS